MTKFTWKQPVGRLATFIAVEQPSYAIKRHRVLSTGKDAPDIWIAYCGIVPLAYCADEDTAKAYIENNCL